MNSTDKKRIESMLNSRANKAIRALTPDTQPEDRIVPSDEAMTALTEALEEFLPTEDDFVAVEAALKTIKAEGFDMYDTNRLRQQFQATPDNWVNPVVNHRHPATVQRDKDRKAALKAAEEGTRAIEAAFENSIIALYSGDEFDTKSYLTAIDEAGAK